MSYMVITIANRNESFGMVQSLSLFRIYVNRIRDSEIIGTYIGIFQIISIIEPTNSEKLITQQLLVKVIVQPFAKT